MLFELGLESLPSSSASEDSMASLWLAPKVTPSQNPNPVNNAMPMVQHRHATPMIFFFLDRSLLSDRRYSDLESVELEFLELARDTSEAVLEVTLLLLIGPAL